MSPQCVPGAIGGHDCGNGAAGSECKRSSNCWRTVSSRGTGGGGTGPPFSETSAELEISGSCAPLSAGCVGRGREQEADSRHALDSSPPRHAFPVTLGGVAV